MIPKLFTGFLAPWYLKSLKDTIINNDFPWNYNPAITLDEKFKYTCDKIAFAENQSSFEHEFYSHDKGGKLSPHFDILTPFINACGMQIPDAEINQLISVKAQLIINNGEQACLYPHVDLDYPHKTILLYLNNSSGQTIIFNESLEKEISKLNFRDEYTYTQNENTVLLFNGLQYQSFCLPTKNINQYVLKLNYI